MDKFDCSGWATRNDLECGDGRIIRRNAFKDCDGKTVPVLWNHDHTRQDAVLGHALLENREEGVYAYVKFNDTEQGKGAKKLVQHGDIRSFSIFANKLAQTGKDVTHGIIRELSLVLAGANPGAYIVDVVAHGEDSYGLLMAHGVDDDGLIMNWDENAINLYDDGSDDLQHADDNESEPEDNEGADNLQHADDPEEKPESKKAEPKSIEAVLNTLNPEQKDVVDYLLGEALKAGAKNADADKGENDEKDDKEVKHSEGGNEEMKKNVFDEQSKTADPAAGVLSHADQMKIITMAKSPQYRSLKAAMEAYCDENSLQHDAISVSGFSQTGEGNISTLFPEPHNVRLGAPELITDDYAWVTEVMNGVTASPYNRIRTKQVDIRNIEGRMNAMRARGFKKGEEKKIVGQYNLVRRDTNPQTIYVKSQLHRDDINDIEDFDLVAYQHNIDLMQLRFETANAILFGDGREVGAEGKIEEDKIRPIWKDAELYTMHVDIDFAAARQELQGTGTGVSFGENYIKAEAMVNTCLYAREKYKGAGTPIMFIDPHQLNIMLLARDMNGHRLYRDVSELAQVFNVKKIVTCEQMLGKVRTTSNGKQKRLHALIVNLADYTVGANKGGKLFHHTQFDIDFNLEKSLMETRSCGALTRLWSAIAIEEDVTPASGSGDSTETEEEGVA